MLRTITGFHAIEEKLRALEKNAKGDDIKSTKIFFAKPGPRVKKIVECAKKIGVACTETSAKDLDAMTAALDETAKDHRGLVMTVNSDEATSQNTVDFDKFIAAQKSAFGNSVVVILDSVTDPHNVGAIMRSCDQFGADLLVLPERRGAKDGEVVERSSAGAANWIPYAVLPNLVRAAEMLKGAGYWIYGADAGGEDCRTVDLSGKVALIMGSEGTGISRLLSEKCDKTISIPTVGKIDSLNVSVATGILLYETQRQNIK